ncbi:hypothetical protein GRI42_13275 [Erythrobacter gaetbuli]|uniref:Uncharacterized protein n=1 Tax=Qipengyuania gaetbuli TaxID=266952 RepID=A0A844Y426_9SPHN|nr:hypothetical protein [Qipengyuania gaetbuli]MXO52279.1 hypothetical protein [Qipengyuania gaetbuli]
MSKLTAKYLLTEEELLVDGRPTRSDIFWALLGGPLVALQVTVSIWRLVSAAFGKPLIVSGWFDITVSTASPWWHLVAGVMFHLVILTILSLVLWGCAMQIQRWRFWRKRA